MNYGNPSPFLTKDFAVARGVRFNSCRDDCHIKRLTAPVCIPIHYGPPREQDWVYKERKQLKEISFRFAAKDAAHSYVSRLAREMHYLPPEMTVAGGRLLFEEAPEVIQETLSAMVPRNMVLTVTWKGVRGDVDKARKKLKTDKRVSMPTRKLSRFAYSEQEWFTISSKSYELSCRSPETHQQSSAPLKAS